MLNGVQVSIRAGGLLTVRVDIECLPLSCFPPPDVFWSKLLS